MGRIRKWNQSFCLLIAVIFALAWVSGCQSKDSSKNKETVKTEAAEQKNGDEKKSSEAGEEGKIPQELLPDKGGQLEGESADSQQSGTAQSVFDASEGGTDPGTDGQAGPSGNHGGGNNGVSGSESQQGQTEAGEIQVSVIVESQAAGNIVSCAESVILRQGATAYDALIALCGDQVAASGGYVTGIGGLSEKDYGAKSGWMYSVNGTRPNKGSSSYTLQDGDEVVWSYVV